jgi:hypothetical protein
MWGYLLVFALGVLCGVVGTFVYAYYAGPNTEDTLP